MLTEVWNKEASAGLGALFGRHLTQLDEQLFGLISDTFRHHNAELRYNAGLREQILARTGGTVRQVEQLVAHRARILQARAPVEAAAGASSQNLQARGTAGDAGDPPE
jgi:hypothetical protein